MLSEETISNKIYFIHSQNVMLDSDLASLYRVETKVLKQSVKRNISRFPEDFMFQLSQNEFNNLRSQIVTSSLRLTFTTRFEKKLEVANCDLET
ncbi:ORF6N domain-containing protein [Flavobacterium crocinum]|uniref:ORF6N domain-containing protein n=1 Tax=Flavobacterium crocinum TaxID=2183896 RepID=UPI00374236DA